MELTLFLEFDQVDHDGQQEQQVWYELVLVYVGAR